MPARYEDALVALYRAPLDSFVAERKRLASELKAGGDKAAAERFAKLRRPPVSAWVVNQLWAEERAAFETLFASAEQVRKGERAALVAHRDALAALRARAAELLEAGGHGANEATLRRVTTNLAALAVAGDFAPDLPGALAGDREPPGFEAAAIGGELPEAPAPSRPKAAPAPEAQRKELEQKKREHEAERRRLEQEEAKRRAERQRLEASLRRAEREVDARGREVEQLRAELEAGERRLARAQQACDELRAELERLSADEPTR